MGNEGGKEEQPNAGKEESAGTPTQVSQVDDNLETESQKMERLERERERKAKQKAEEDRRKKDLQEKELERELQERKRREEEEKRKRRQQEEEERERKRQMEEEEKERKRQLEEETKQDAENRRLADAANREKIRAQEAEAERVEAERVEAEANKKKKDAVANTKADDGFLDDLVAMTAEDDKSPKGYVPPKLSAGWQMAAPPSHGGAGGRPGRLPSVKEEAEEVAPRSI